VIDRFSQRVLLRQEVEMPVAIEVDPETVVAHGVQQADGLVRRIKRNLSPSSGRPPLAQAD
jgi:hypothetical protein